MTGRHWFRKDVLLPIFYILAFGAGLYWLQKKIMTIPAAAESDFVTWALRIILFAYILLVAITLKHIFSTYDLERYDPGDPASVKRLLRRHRYRLAKQIIPEERMLVAIEQALLDRHYRLEAESHIIGRIYRRHRLSGFIGRPAYDRVIILQHEPLNVLMVDQILKDTIRQIKADTEKPSRRNLLIIVTRMADAADAASAAAGVVNFLGKFKGGTLCPIVLATRQFRLFYPIDRTLLPRSHRWYQNGLLLCLHRVIRKIQRENAASHSPDPDTARIP